MCLLKFQAFVELLDRNRNTFAKEKAIWYCYYYGVNISDSCLPLVVTREVSLLKTSEEEELQSFSEPSFTQQGVRHPGPNPAKQFSAGSKSTACSHFSR